MTPAPAAPAGRTLRALAVLVFIGVPLALFAAAGGLLLQAEATGVLAARQAATVAQLQRRLAAAISGEGRQIDTGAIYLAAPTPELAAATLQQLVIRLTDAAGVRLIETQPLDRFVDLSRAAPAGAAAPTDETVQLRVSLDAANADLLALLTAIEGGLPLLTVEQLQIRRLSRTGADDDADPLLRVDLVIGAHWKAAAP
ncbi:type II secretion system protein GspM [Methylobrevis albus]|uniref:General secretion pathway protein M n=1 Tax=Methylobrevis albus TaxID=2793297 RepID=A0A931I2R4_9HYPH|nr:type II secretion system protein GspM [Methylobrevis albus]MBH0237846.1 hypothetical protein [Methylobrevis albus]